MASSPPPPAAANNTPTTTGWTVDGAPFPQSHPRGYGADAAMVGQDDAVEPRFDPRVHLQLEAPKWIKPLVPEGGDGREPGEIAFPVPVRPAANAPGATATSATADAHTVPFAGLAFTSSFRLLSDAGIRAMRGIIQRNEQFAKSNERLPKTLRGLGYLSKFVRDFTYCPEVLNFLSRMAGEPVHPHNMPVSCQSPCHSTSPISSSILSVLKQVAQAMTNTLSYIPHADEHRTNQLWTDRRRAASRQVAL